jgi:cytochrome P450
MSEGDDWVRQRRLIAPSFTKFSVGNSFGYVNLCGKRFMKRWAKKSVAGEFIADNVQNEMQCFTLDVITLFAWAFDLNCTEQEDTQTQRDVLAYIDAIYRRMWNLTPLYKMLVLWILNP